MNFRLHPFLAQITVGYDDIVSFLSGEFREFFLPQETFYNRA